MNNKKADMMNLPNLATAMAAVDWYGVDLFPSIDNLDKIPNIPYIVVPMIIMAAPANVSAANLDGSPDGWVTDVFGGRTLLPACVVMVTSVSGSSDWTSSEAVVDV